MCHATESVVYFSFERAKETHMIIDLGSVKGETKGQNTFTQFRERGGVNSAGAPILCYHPTANQPNAKPSACWGA